MNVAIVKLSAIGDVVHALPVAAAVKRRFADARVTWVAEAREAALLGGHADVEAVPVAEARADAILAQVGIGARDRLVLVNPGAGRADKRWPVERFRELAQGLAREAGTRVLVVWGPGEADDARAIATGSGDVTVAPATT